MGISTSSGALLCRARARGAHFERTATIGRQSLDIPPDALERLARGVGVDRIDWPHFAVDGFADDFIRVLLGAQEVTSIDFSDYQGAPIVHDLNRPIDASLHRSFDAVVDGGSLEHIFDVKQALANYMNLVKRGGDLFIVTTANNLFGHGFYQFSAELFYRVFDAANGFSVQHLVLVESPFVSVSVSPRQRLFEIADPAIAGSRIHLVNDKPVMLFVHARRIGDEAPFRTSPLQSDYHAKWQVRRSAGARPSRFSYLTPWQELRRAWKQRRRKSFRNRRAFHPLEM